MRSFLYWIDTDRQAGGSADAPALLAPMSRRSVGPVPDKPGLLLFESAMPSALAKYSNEGQRWVEVAPGRWVGFWESYRPGPADLARAGDDFVEGVAVELGDGSEWILPRLLKDTRESGLPRSLRLSADGHLIGDVAEKYKALALDGERLWRYILHIQRDEPAPQPAMTEAEIFRLVSRVVGVNYRLGPGEVGALGLVTSGNFLRLAFLIIGYDTLLEMESSPPGE
jgi:hypothetical protein